MVKFLQARPLSDRARFGLMYASAILVVSGFVSTAVSLRAEPLGPRVPTTVAVHLRPQTPSIYRVHIVDPFAAQPQATDGVSSAFSAAPGNVPSTVPQLGQLSVPNPDGTMPTGTPIVGGQTATYSLQATLLGDPSVAEFESGSDVEILKVGDSLGDRKIRSISKGEVTFADGSQIMMANPQATTGLMTPPPIMTLTTPSPSPSAPVISAPVEAPPATLQPVGQSTAAVTPAPIPMATMP